MRAIALTLIALVVGCGGEPANTPASSPSPSPSPSVQASPPAAPAPALSQDEMNKMMGLPSRPQGRRSLTIGEGSDGFGSERSNAPADGDPGGPPSGQPASARGSAKPDMFAKDRAASESRLGVDGNGNPMQPPINIGGRNYRIIQMKPGTTIPATQAK